MYIKQNMWVQMHVGYTVTEFDREKDVKKYT